MAAKKKQRSVRKDTLVPKPEEINRLVEAELLLGRLDTKGLHDHLADYCACSRRSIEDVRRYPKAVSERMLFHIAAYFRVPLGQIAVLPPGYSRHRTPIAGRQVELRQLAEVWSGGETAILSVRGMGGEGKTALAEEFIETLLLRDDVPVHRADFYQRTTALDCLRKFVTWCTPSAAPVSDEVAVVATAVQWVQKGMGNRRILLVLEGFENLMTGQSEKGPVISDPVMRRFLHALAQAPTTKRSGLVVITSREPLHELAPFKGRFIELELEPLKDKDAESLFWRLLDPGAASAPEYLSDTAVMQFFLIARGHALTITLAAASLRESGDKQFDLSKLAGSLRTEELEIKKKGALNASRRYWLPEFVLRHAHKSLPEDERQLMHVVGCAVAPISDRLLREVLASGRSDFLPKLRALGLAKIKRQILPRLCRRRLLSQDEEGITAHPLVKAFFAARESGLAPAVKSALHAAMFRSVLAEVNRDSELHASRGLVALAHGTFYACESGQAREGYARLGIARFNPRIMDAHEVVQQAPSSVLSVLRPFFSDDSWSQFAPQPADGALPAKQQLQVALLAAKCWQQVSTYRSDFAQSCGQLCANLVAILDQPDDAELKAYLLFSFRWRAALFGGRLDASLECARQIPEVLRQGYPALREASQVLLGSSSFFMGRFADSMEALRRAEKVAGTDEVRGSLLFQGEINDPLAAVLGYKALCEWHAGQAEAAIETMRKGVAEAASVGRPFALAVTLFFEGLLHYLRLDRPAMKALVARLRAACSGPGYAIWEAAALMFEGWAGSGTEGLKKIRAGINTWKASSSKLALPMWLEMAADVEAELDDYEASFADIVAAMRVASETMERWREVSLMAKRADAMAKAGTSKREIKALLLAAKELSFEQRAPALAGQVSLTAKRLGLRV